jgi:hypothetical protein
LVFPGRDVCETKGTICAECDNAMGSGNFDKDDQMVINPSILMICLMITTSQPYFFLTGHIIDGPNQWCCHSEEFQM